MRIPLDYYRILGLPNQATSEQLRQAHRDRTLQLPRREYSEAAIATRKSLLDQAYAVLSNPEQRQDYDESFLASTYELESNPPEGLADDALDVNTPTIEIDDRQLIGALLVLQELGEYELVLRLGRPYLSSGTTNLRDGRFGDPKLVLPDIVLTVALSCLELGREQWHQGQYENAAEALETGQELLLREGLFASVRHEIGSDLYKLRPYRILELLALPIEHNNDRQQGIRLLKDMLHERGGIDGAGNDQSGLSIDDFLRFIQQLRGYLTAEEQQTLFEEESRRPSAVATYLAVYALLGRGFAQQQPALIRRAKAMLARLGSRQDVHLEQAVCALLLGQTEEASRVLELSQEYEQIAFIRENSQGSPDLLPGLCLYAERWLQDEVFPHFRDLAKQQALLKSYFSDEQVQAYLEELPTEAESRHDWSLTQSWNRRQEEATQDSKIATRNGRSTGAVSVEQFGSRAATATLTSAAGSTVVTLSPAERFANRSSEGSLQEVKSPVGRNPSVRRSPGGDASESGKANRSGVQADAVPSRRGEGSTGRNRLPILLLGVAAAGLLGFILIKSVRSLIGSSTSPASEPLLVQLDQPVVPLPEASEAASISGEMNQATAQAVLDAWYSAKQAAMGQTHSPEKLAQILAEPKLTEWQRNSEEAKRDNLAIQYEHSLKIDSVDVSQTDPNQAIVSATVTEIRKYFQGSQPSDTQTDRDMQVQYTMVRQDNQWRIKDWE
ncbi:MAG: DUF4101 domain-containing protein [Myxacorys californica WJT36-NPBG1]|nr:DUF4101 domain-containing protein [Myxacorys californica WJT36-NPBG1]